MMDWFEWNGRRCTEYGIHVTEQPPITIPSERATFTNVPGRSGSLITLEGDDVYDDLLLTASCFIADSARIPAIAAWLRGSGTVSFANRQGGFYHARIVNQIPFEKILRGNPHRAFVVNFRCKPFWYQEMRSAAQAEYEKGCDLPTVTLKVDFVNCADTVEYAQYAALSNIFLGDSVRVIARRIGVEVSMRMTQYTYDCLTRKYTSVTLGTVADTLEGSMVSVRQLASGSITGTKLALNSVGTGQLQSGSVGSLQIKNAAIGSAHIQDASITRAHIAEALIDVLNVNALTAVTAKIKELVAGSITSDELYKRSLWLKMFLLLTVLLFSVSLLLYGIVMAVMPSSYKYTLTTNYVEQIDHLVTELEGNSIDVATRRIYEFCVNHNACALLKGGNTQISFGTELLEDTEPFEEGAAQTTTTVLALSDGTYNLQIYMSAKVVNQLTQTFWRLLPIISAIVLGISLIASYFVSRFLTKPILEISDISGRLTALDMTWRCDTKRSDEVGVLASNLNTMAVRLNEALGKLTAANQKLQADIDQERQQEKLRVDFFRAVSHELKTPITVLKGELEGMIYGVGEYKDRDTSAVRTFPTTAPRLLTRRRNWRKHSPTPTSSTTGCTTK